jgi:hypothetical protein
VPVQIYWRQRSRIRQWSEFLWKIEYLLNFIFIKISEKRKINDALNFYDEIYFFPIHMEKNFFNNFADFSNNTVYT